MQTKFWPHSRERTCDKLPPFLLPNYSNYSIMHCPPLAKQLTQAGDILEDDCFYLVCFLLGNCLASGFYMPTFRNTLSVPSS